MSKDSDVSLERESHFKTERPDSRFGSGAFTALRALVHEVMTHRSHVRTMFAADFSNATSGTALGQFWNVVLPLVPISVYLLLVQLRVFPSYEGLEPAVYISFNVTLWYFFAGLIQRPISVVKSRTSDSMKTSLPLSTSIVSSFAQLTFETIVRLLLVLILMFVYSQVPSVSLMGFVLSLVIGSIFCFSVGLILSIFNAVFSDVERVTTILLQYGIFVSGVIFPISSMGPLVFLEDYNPMAVFISNFRNSVFFGTGLSGASFWVWSGLALLLFFLAVRFFYVMERRIRSVVS